MKRIPKIVKDHVANAHYYLDAADCFPAPTRDAVQILLLLIAWENIKIAEEELHAWVNKNPVEKKLYKSHSHKFRNARKSIDRIIIEKRGKPVRTITFSSGSDFKKLLETCRYGPKGGNRDLASAFAQGWHSDEFRTSLIGKIEWVEMMVEIYAGLIKRDN